MTEEQANLVIKITDNLREGINNNHNFTKTTAEAIKKCADIIITLEKRVNILEDVVEQLEKEMENK
tara:strand:- start:43 stop:240 length:198 start_codon:yes stop_codon:yes gene_type:complete